MVHNCGNSAKKLIWCPEAMGAVLMVLNLAAVDVFDSRPKPEGSGRSYCAATGTMLEDHVG